MPIAFTGSAVPTGNPTTSHTYTIPTVAVGEWLYVAFISRDHTAATALATCTDNDSGGNTWTSLAVTTDRKAYLFRKQATSATTGKLITVAGCVGSSAGVLKCFSGTTGVTDALASHDNPAGTETRPGFTPAEAGEMLIGLVYNRLNDNAVTAMAYGGNATSMVEKLSTGGSDCAVSFGHLLQVGGPTATGDFTWSQVDGTTYSRILAIRPTAAVDNRNGTLVVTGGGVLTSVQQKGAQVTIVGTGGGVVTSVRQKGALRAVVATAGGVLTSVRSKGGLLAVPLTGGGVLVLAGEAGGEGEAHSGAFVVTGGGTLALGVRTGRFESEALTGGGIMTLLASGGHFVTVNLTGGGQLLLASGGVPVALSDLGAVMDAIAAAIEAQGVTSRTYAYPAESVSVPCAVVGYPDEIEFDIVYQRGADLANIPVYFLTGRVVDRAARDRMAAIISGATGIKEALDGDLGGAVQSLRVTDMKVLNVQVAGVDYLAAKFNAEVIK